MGIPRVFNSDPRLITFPYSIHYSKGMKVVINQGTKFEETNILGNKVSEHTFEVAGRIEKRSFFERFFTLPWIPWLREKTIWFGSDKQ